MSQSFIVGVVFPILGVSLVVICSLIILRDRTPVTLTNFFAAVCMMIALVLWADPYGQAIDRWAAVAGLGTIITRISISAGASLHAIAVCLGLNRWDRTRRLILLPGLVVANLLYLVFWNQARTLPNAERLFYGIAYHGRPDAVFAMSVARGIVEIWYCAFGVYAYVMLTQRTYRTLRWKALFTSATLLIVALTVALVPAFCTIAEAVSDHVGVKVPWLVPLYLAGITISIGIFAVVYLRGAVLRPIARAIKARTLRYATEVKAATADALEVNSHIDDKMTLLIAYADPDIRRRMRQTCIDHAVTYDELMLGLAAAMIVTLRPENIDRRRPKGDQHLDLDAVRRGSLGQLVELAETDAFFFSDANMIAALACGAERHGLTLRRKPRALHHRLAMLLEGVLNEYDQPDHYRAAFRAELLRRQEDRERLQRDLPHLANDDLTDAIQSA